MELICRYRKAGISLKDIKKLLEVELNEYTEILIEQHNSIISEIEKLQQQQTTVVTMMKKRLHSVKIDGEATRKLHITFESTSPTEHTMFLKSIGMNDDTQTKLSNGQVKEVKSTHADRLSNIYKISFLLMNMSAMIFL